MNFNKAERALGVAVSVVALACLAYLHQRSGLPAVPIVYVCGVTFLTVSAYGYDKFCAVTKRDRISEKTLYGWTLLGGWPAAFIAQEIFSHKTTKLSFRVMHWCAAFCNMALVWFCVTVLNSSAILSVQ